MAFAQWYVPCAQCASLFFLNDATESMDASDFACRARTPYFATNWEKQNVWISSNIW